MAESAHAGRRQDVGCPFCGLICDDLTVDSTGTTLEVVAAGCAVSRRGFAEAPPGAAAMIDGKPVPLDTALGRAAEILARARSPLFMVSADVAGTKAALRLADRLGGTIDHPESDALFRNLRVLQDSGAFTTTLSEIRNRADVVLVVGPDPSPAAPRFYERCVTPEKTLLVDAGFRRDLFRLGPDAVPHEAAPPAMHVVPCAMADLPAMIGALGALLRERPGGAAGHVELATVAARLKTARYAVIVWAPGLFSSGGELIAQALLEIARLLNRTTRAAVLALGGGGNLLGVNQVCIWQTGFPLRTSFGGGAPEHDLYRFSGRRMIANGEADAQVWVSAFAAAEPPRAVADLPSIVLAPRLADGQAPAVYLPVGTPGLDHAGQVFRTDIVVAVRLDAMRAAAVPSAGSVLDQIHSALGETGGGR
jgi:formylmethanofuran dehydrogenase subunit B